MKNEQMLHALQDKMSEELDALEGWLLKQSPKEILEHTFEYTTKSDIVLLVEEADLSDKQLRALLSSSAPLEDVYKKFRNIDTGLMDTLQTCLEDWADTLLKLQREKQRDTPEKKSVADRLRQKPPAPSGPEHPPMKGGGAR